MDDLHNIAELSHELQSLNVDLLVIFGSQIDGTVHPDSDIDIGVVFSRIDTNQRAYGQLYALLQAAFPNHRLDLVDLPQAPLALQHRATQHGKVIYQSTPSSFANVREQVMSHYYDFLPIIKIHEQALQL